MSGRRFRRVLPLVLASAVLLGACGDAVDRPPGGGAAPGSGSGAERSASIPGAVADRSDSAVVKPGPLWGSSLEPPIPIGAFSLTDQDGRTFRFPDDIARADVTLLYLGYTHCPDICPDTMAEIAVALRAAGAGVADHVGVVFVTVDPKRDDPARLRAWLGLFNEGFVGLTGPSVRIDRILEQLGYRPGVRSDLGGGDYLVGHPVEYLAIAPDGTARIAYPWDITVPQLQEDLTTLIEEGW